MKTNQLFIGGLNFQPKLSSIKTLIVWVIAALVMVQTVQYQKITDAATQQIQEAVEQKAPLQIPERDLMCLARNVYFEARGESQTGQSAVAFVTLNRANSGNFPASVCEVVHQKIRGVCQFSWVCAEGMYISDMVAFDKAKDIAKRVMIKYNEMKDPSNGALFFRNLVVRDPKQEKHATVIGNHVFYR